MICRHLALQCAMQGGDVLPGISCNDTTSWPNELELLLKGGADVCARDEKVSRCSCCTSCVYSAWHTSHAGLDCCHPLTLHNGLMQYTEP